jgi:hypothetical protein
MEKDAILLIQIVERIMKLQAEVFAHRLLLGQWEKLRAHPQLEKLWQISDVYDGLKRKQEEEAELKFRQLLADLHAGTSASDALKALAELA